MKKPCIIAHRGNSSEAPENTLAAFASANEADADFIELDVHLSKDCHIVVFHDETPGRTAIDNFPYKISKMPLSKIQKLDAGSWFNKKYAGEKIPTLEEVFEYPFHEGLGLMIEIKVSENKLLLPFSRVLEQFFYKYKHTKLFKKSLFGSFSSDMIRHLHQLMPDKPFIGISDNEETLHRHLQENTAFIAISQEQATEKLIRNLKNLNKQVWIYSVDDVEIAKTLVGFGASGIITNRPKVLKAHL